MCRLIMVSNWNVRKLVLTVQYVMILTIVFPFKKQQNKRFLSLSCFFRIMNSNDDIVESDEHDEEEQIDDREVESEVEHNEQEEENDISDQEGSNQNNNEGDDDDENHSSTHQEQEENETRDAVDPTNPLDEDSIEAAQNLTQEDVFGEELSDLSEDEDSLRRKKQNNNNLNGSQDGHEGDEDELIEEHEEEEQILVDTPHVTCDLGRDIHLVKLPSFMKVEPKPFDTQYFNEDVRDEDDEESKARKKLRLENTIRWRYNTNDSGETIRESNTRLVRWSDGSLSLHVGKEIFDVSKANIQSDHNHLFVRHQKSMQAQAVFRTKLSFRQHSNDSLAHLKLKFASKANPAPKVRVLSNIKEHIKISDEMRKKEEQRVKAEERRQNQQLRQRERAAYRDRKMSASYLEDRDEDDEQNEQESLNTIKKNVKKKKLQGGYQAEDTSEDENDNGHDEKFNHQRSSTSLKHRKIDSSDEENSNNEQQTKQKRIKSVGDDDEEDERESD
ncbi:unnamed protein product [Rotaria magnacalcarata]|uniref:RNA polymerase-associated protein LEO1 n=5 Tax=Rotaria TaxID=231623 RepID=A0A816LFX4_9BILA|nr:unnamed protein product [Rotaria magnacalcarata]